MLIDQKIELNFPLNNGGQEVGISEGGIEHFTGKIVESLCKEILQNSLDARVGNEKVKVKFDIIEMERKSIPEISNLTKTIESCLDYWENNEKAKKILTKSLSSIKGDTIKILRISDSGTCGLTGADKKRDSNFFNLVKSSGASSKGGQSGGSFGIGKFAPFACSYPRTIFYSTLDMNGNYAFQGVSRLVTHEINGETTQGVGYIGDSNRNMPILNKEIIPKEFLRNTTGTDINIIGFNGDSSWKEVIIKSSFSSFFESIYNGKLEIQIGDDIIDKDNFKEFGEKYIKEVLGSDYTYEYFKCILSENNTDKKIYKEDFIFQGDNFGEIELHLYKSRGFHKKVAYLRSTGMKIIDKGNFRTTLNFSGVLKLNGEKINSFIRSLETPSHDRLEEDRHEDPKKAKKILEELNRLIRQKVTEFSKINDGEEIDIKGISKFLPDTSKENEILNYSLKNGKIKNIKIETYEKNKNKKTQANELNLEPMIDNNDSIEGSTEITKENGPIFGGNGISTGGLAIGKNIENEINGPNSTNQIIDNTTKKISITKKKALINDKIGNRYKVIIEALESCSVYVQLKALYEDGRGEIVEVSNANLLNLEQLEIKENKYIKINLKQKEKEIIFVNLKESIYSSMEVLINEK